MYRPKGLFLSNCLRHLPSPKHELDIVSLLLFHRLWCRLKQAPWAVAQIVAVVAWCTWITLMMLGMPTTWGNMETFIRRLSWNQLAECGKFPNNEWINALKLKYRVANCRPITSNYLHETKDNQPHTACIKRKRWGTNNWVFGEPLN